MKNVQHNSLSRAIYTIFALSMLLSSCVADRVPQVRESQQTELEEGEPFTVEMSGFGSNDEVQGLRAKDAVSTIADIKTLRLLVFDEEGKFLYSQEAVLGAEANVSSKPDDDFLPTMQRKGIEEAKRFKVTLLKSNKPRRIHFIANYNWTGFDQDYFLSGISDGDLVSSMLVDRKDFTPMWGCVNVDAIDQNTLKDKVIVLLRSYAKVTIDDSQVARSSSETDKSSLEVQKFLVCNYPEGGALAPFVYTPEHKYAFEYDKPEPTIVPGVKTIKGDQEGDLIPVSQPFNLHEWHNKDHNLFVIIKGHRFDKSGKNLGSRYYKLDFVSRRDDGTKDFLPILRNYHYSFKISKVLSDGYETLAEAVAAPASNNVFASVELEEFATISDGETVLEITPIVTYAVKAGKLSFQVIATPKPKSLTYTPGWDPNNDPYLGTLTKTADGFEVQVKATPTDSRIEYKADVIYTDEQGKKITRPVKIILSSPFEFNAKLEHTDELQYQRLTFEVSKYLKAATLPFDIYIEATNLTPRNTDKENKLELEFKGKKIYYRYTLRDPKFIGNTISFDFLVNNPTKATSLVLRSDYYNDQKVELSVAP